MRRVSKTILTEDADSYGRNGCNKLRNKIVQAFRVVVVFCAVGLTGFAQLGRTILGKILTYVTGAHYCHDTQK